MELNSGNLILSLWVIVFSNYVLRLVQIFPAFYISFLLNGE